MTYFEKKVENMIEVAKRISKEEEKNFAVNVIDSLSFYLSNTNSNYQYNESYLIDYTNACIKWLTGLLEKRIFADDFINELISKAKISGVKIDYMKVMVENIWYAVIVNNKSEGLKTIEDGNITNLKHNTIYITTLVKDKEGALLEDYNNCCLEDDILVEEVKRNIINFYKRVKNFDKEYKDKEDKQYKVI